MFASLETLVCLEMYASDVKMVVLSL